MHKKAKFEECGLTVHKEFPFLAVTPDLILNSVFVTVDMCVK